MVFAAHSLTQVCNHPTPVRPTKDTPNSPYLRYSHVNQTLAAKLRREQNNEAKYVIALLHAQGARKKIGDL